MSDTSPLPAKAKGMIHERFAPQAGVEAVCLKSTPLPGEKRLTYCFYVDKTALSNFSHVFADMLTVGESTPGEPDVVQLSEDSGTIALLLECMSEDLQSLPDLTGVCQSGIIRLYAAAFKYGMVHVQHVSEQNIRARLGPKADLITQTTDLEALFRHALDFDRSDLLIEAAAAIARHVSKPDDRFFFNLLQSVSRQGAKALLEAYSNHQRDKETTLSKHLDSWIQILGARGSAVDIRLTRAALVEMDEAARELEPTVGGSKRRSMRGRTADQYESCNCCHVPSHPWDGGAGGGWGNSNYQGGWSASNDHNDGWGNQQAV